MSQPLVLSLFPGIDLLGHAFAAEGFCIVTGPDVILGGDIRAFHVPAGHFAGVIGGPPCQPFSPLVHLVRQNGFETKHTNLIPEFERVVAEAAPCWFVMEESPFAPLPAIAGYGLHEQVLNNRWLGEEQNRVRRISFGSRDGRRLQIRTVALEAIGYEYAVHSGARAVPVSVGGGGKRKTTAEGKRTGPSTGPRRSIGDMLALQGFPRNLLDECPITAEGKRRAIGNGVSLPMGRAIAKAVKAAMYPDAVEGIA